MTSALELLHVKYLDGRSCEDFKSSASHRRPPLGLAWLVYELPDLLSAPRTQRPNVCLAVLHQILADILPDPASQARSAVEDGLLGLLQSLPLFLLCLTCRQAAAVHQFGVAEDLQAGC